MGAFVNIKECNIAATTTPCITNDGGKVYIGEGRQGLVNPINVIVINNSSATHCTLVNQKNGEMRIMDGDITNTFQSNYLLFNEVGSNYALSDAEKSKFEGKIIIANK